MAHVLGVDIGGTGIKAAPVDLDTGTLETERIKLDTPRPSEPAVSRSPASQAGVVDFAWSAIAAQQPCT